MSTQDSDDVLGPLDRPLPTRTSYARLVAPSSQELRDVSPQVAQGSQEPTPGSSVKDEDAFNPALDADRLL